ncbi:AT-hook motif nuclear-localized protein 1 [Cucurbita argyrosperma subsp. argyrosperma]|uniref:AT-hook motif nuclear-localized protein n=1 Tax=Cucurbita moschata TaxID=3662 RepID=A0A6J1E9U5_CUCMO|nr:AT-hook motif nuclear-localized protein 7-like [Cucurbita moschata]XP_022924741.1 AT-hook motif nuclear-localized protein 7-like [Cucurbita moschata]XP_022924742.1 AT-hook motif nuclear-localized protein 7-like [Cucurbita moschata]KAG7018945.1 AT-hook motif nuclear-localized protein 1 [Cucurbita argyrosperma subsp. argyrosperma]
MEEREAINTGVTVIGAEAPSAYHVAPRTENPPPASGGGGGSPTVAASPVSVGLPGSETTGKKKRGRPRKYGPDGTVTMALSPLPLSSSAPGAGGFSITKRGKGRLGGSEFKHHKKMGMEYIGEWNACSVGTNFMPHIITVNAGEDVTMKIISFSQQGPRAICILSANGVISNVTLRQPDSSGGTLTYEGRFEILSLSGSFMPTENQGSRSRSGGMSVSLASPDGRVVGGGVAGLLIAAGPVQVVVGSFLPTSSQQEPKVKKQKPESVPAAAPVAAPTTTPATTVPTSNADTDDSLNGNGQPNPGSLKPASFAPSAFQRDNWGANAAVRSSLQEPRNSPTDINISLPG